MFTLRKYVNSIILLQLLISFNNINGILGDDIPEGGECMWQGKRGICKILENCTSLYNEIESGKLSPYSVLKCSFKGTHFVACCPDIDPSINTKGTGPDAVVETDEKLPESDIYFPGQKKPTSTRKPITSNEPVSERNGNLPKRPSEKACDEIIKKYGRKSLGEKILFGKNAIPGEFPHMVALGYGPDSEWNCAGTLISDRYILTAGHCVKNRRVLPIMARMGRNDIEKVSSDDKYPMDVPILNTSIKLHEGYRQTESYNDIALIQLPTPLEFNDDFFPACLYTSTDEFPENKNLTITGWGIVDINTRSKSSYLQKATVKYVPLEKCSSNEVYKRSTVLPKGIIKTQLCAIDEKSDTCSGDSGGPLQIVSDLSITTIVGITSFGVSCGTNVPGVYTKVASYLDWIEKIVWPDSI